MFVVFGSQSVIIADCVPCKEKIALRQSMQEVDAALSRMKKDDPTRAELARSLLQTLDAYNNLRTSYDELRARVKAAARKHDELSAAIRPITAPGGES